MTTEHDDVHGPRANYCEQANRYIMGRTHDGECPLCGVDLTRERMTRLRERLRDAGFEVGTNE